MEFAPADLYWELQPTNGDQKSFLGPDSISNSIIIRDATSGSKDEKLEPKGLFLEFFRAVVPLTAFIVLYIGILLQKWILTWTMAIGLVNVIVGLAIFKFGLMTGLMPFGESIGEQLPQKVSLLVIFLASLLLGVLVTFSEPGINSLQLVGEILDGRGSSFEGEKHRSQSLLMYILSSGKSFELLLAVAIGVGFASALGVMRLQFRCSLKVFIFCSMVPLLALTFVCWRSALLSHLVGVSWDCGAITTGPATVPIVLSMGIGVAKTARKSNKIQHSHAIEQPNSDLDGFGIVTLASLVPVFTVMVFGLLCGLSDESTILAGSHSLHVEHNAWTEFPLRELWQSCRAVGPLASFLIVVQGLLIQERPAGTHPVQLLQGFLATLVGLFVFNIGLTYGSVPLGEQAGQNLPIALSGNMFKSWVAAEKLVFLGQSSVMIFGFVAGFMATVIDLEPCGLGETVEKLSNGVFTKRDLILSVASGVGFGIVLGFAKVLYAMDLLLVLGVGYTIALCLTIFVDEGLCCIAWDSAGVTTGPVTVPLVLSMGVGICGEVSSMDGFGILACASVCPIITVLAASILRTRVCKHRRPRQHTEFRRQQLSDLTELRGCSEKLAPYSSSH